MVARPPQEANSPPQLVWPYSISSLRQHPHDPFQVPYSTKWLGLWRAIHIVRNRQDCPTCLKWFTRHSDLKSSLQLSDVFVQPSLGNEIEPRILRLGMIRAPNGWLVLSSQLEPLCSGYIDGNDTRHIMEMYRHAHVLCTDAVLIALLLSGMSSWLIWFAWIQQEAHWSATHMVI